MVVEIWHHILWSRYKAAVFSDLQGIVAGRGWTLKVFQIAETERDRISLSSVDLSVHKYNYVLLFNGPYEGVSLIRRVICLARHMLYTESDVIVIAGYNKLEFIIQAFILFLRNKPRAVFCDSTAYDRKSRLWKTIVKRAVFALCRNVFCYGERSKSYVLALGVPRDYIFTRCQAAALPKWYNVNEVRRKRIELAVSGETALFLYVGRLSPEKRVDILIKAFAELLARLPAARLRIVGSGPDISNLVNLAYNLGLERTVEFVGAQSGDQLYRNYFEATAFILPSRSEPWGLVVNEALHFGCPVIVSERCGCVPELVDGSAVGFVVRSDDVSDLASKMLIGAHKWADQGSVFDSCQRVISPYSTRAAALAIADGIDLIFGRSGTVPFDPA